MISFSKKLICVFMLAVTFALAFCSESIAASEDWEMSGASWEITPEGRIIALWDKTAKPTDYNLKLFIENKKQSVFSRTLSETSYDFSDIILEHGRLNYYFIVYPKKGGSKYKAKSDILEVDSTMTKKIKNLQKADEEEAKKYGPVTISKLELKLTEEKITPGELKPIGFTSQAKYKVKDVVFSKQYADWVPKEQITITMTVEPQKDYLFGENMKIVCDKADSVSMSGSGQSRFVTVKYSPYSVLPKPENLYLTSDGKLHWDKVANATSYSVDISRDGEKIESKKASGPQIDISDYLDDGGVSLVLKSQNKTQSFYYVTSAKTEIPDLDAFAAENSIPGIFKVSGSSLRYIPDNQSLDDGDKASLNPDLAWQFLAGHWYHFDNKGYAAGPGWWQDKDNPNDPNAGSGGSWYYFDSNHRMLVNTITPDGCRVDENGRWVK